MGEVVVTDFRKKYNEKPLYEHVWMCNCESTLMCLTDTGIFCADCGEKQQSDNWDYTMFSVYNPKED